MEENGKQTFKTKNVRKNWAEEKENDRKIVRLEKRLKSGKGWVGMSDQGIHVWGHKFFEKLKK